MADAYIRWRYPSDPSRSEDCSCEGGPSAPRELNDGVPVPSAPTNIPPFAQASEIEYDGAAMNSPPTPTEVEIPIIDVYTLSISIKIPHTEDKTTASTLAGLGFIGNAPFHPSLAVSMKTLELYRILRRRKPSFSVEAFVKVICDFATCIWYVFSFIRTAFLFHRRFHIVRNTAVILRRVRHISRSHQSC